MTFNEIWEQLCRKEPLLRRPESQVTFTSENLRSLLEQVYEQGERSGKEKQKYSGDLGDIFGFGRRCQ